MKPVTSRDKEDKGREKDGGRNPPSLGLAFLDKKSTFQSSSHLL